MNRILSLVKPRVLSIVLIVLGLLAVILAVASATIWRPSQTAVATLKPAATTAYVVTGDGVLNWLTPLSPLLPRLKMPTLQLPWRWLALRMPKLGWLTIPTRKLPA